MQAILLLLALGAAPEASDEARAAAKVHFDVGEKHQRLGRFEEAIEAYAKAYELLPEPAFLFNIGQCHRNLGRWERAVYFFRSYAAAVRDEAARKDVNALIAALEVEMEKERVAEERRAAEAREAAVRDEAPPAIIALPAAESPEEEGAVWPYVLAAVAAAVAGAVIAGVAVAGGGGVDRDPERTLDFSGR